jgi:hypothetical protein
MPELRWLQGYPFALGIMFVTAATMLLWFYKKGWLTPQEKPSHPRPPTHPETASSRPSDLQGS